MNIVFMGTPDFAVPSLKILHESSEKILTIVTAPDKERGRGQKVSYTPVKKYAIEKNIPLLQPFSLKDPLFIEKLKSINADLFIVVAFKILPPEVFRLPLKGSFNLHASLLPKYRGAAPIQWALINGEKETGVTTFSLEEKVDTGNIYLQEKIEISDEDNFGSLHDKLSLLGASVVKKTVDLIKSGNVILKEQDNAISTPAPKITKETGKIDWLKPAEEIKNLVRGLSPYPGAFFNFKDKLIKVFKAEVVNEKLNPGEISESRDHLVIGCGKNSLKILELQQEGRKIMHTEEFLRGFSFKN
jgi:methionyl-tRNA formyltransferase